VYVITTEPAATPVTNPVLVTVAVDVFELTHGVVVAAVTLPVNWIVDPTHTAFDPVIVGTAFTVIVVVIEQPLLFV
jgi:hypothetical protein